MNTRDHFDTITGAAHPQRRHRGRRHRKLGTRTAVTAVVVTALLFGVALAAATDHRASALSGEFGTSKDIWISRSALLELPTSGDAWDRLAATATGAWGTASIANQDSNHDVATLAGALYAVRMNDAAMRSRVVEAIESAVETENGGRTLALGRNLTGYVLAADLVGHDSARFSNWLRSVRIENLDGRTLVSTHEDRPNNWGAHAGAARIAAARFLGDHADLAAATAVFRGYLGDRSAYADFAFGAADWQADELNPVPINPVGATKLGIDVDGALVDDIRRCECPVALPAPKENYQWEAMQGIVAQAELLRVAGHADVWQWSDAAIARAVNFLHDNAHFPAEGDDRFLTYLIDANLGTDFSTGVTDAAGKSLGFTGWTHADRQPPAPAPTTTAAPQQTTLPAPTTTSTTMPPIVTIPPATTTPTAPAPTTTVPPAPTATTAPPTTIPVITLPPPGTTSTNPSASWAVDSTLLAGSSTGSHVETWSRDGNWHTLKEAESSDRRSSQRHDLGELRWTIPAVGGNQVLDVVMTIGPSLDADDGFSVEWSTDGSRWTPIALVASGGSLDLTVDLGAPTGSVLVRVIDPDRTAGQRSPDWVGIDHLAIRAAP